MEGPPPAARILVVDDDPAGATGLAEVLEAWGYEASAATTAAQAEQLLEEREHELLLTDLRMPGVDGMELLGRTRERWPDLGVVMVTGVVDTRTAIAAMRAGARDYVTKPFDLDEVRVVVERSLDYGRLQRENAAYREHLERTVALRTRELEQQVREVGRLYAELKTSYEATMHALVRALGSRDPCTKGHSVRVVEYAERLGVEMGLAGEALERLRWGAILHDVGKIGVPDAILNKPGRLDESELAEMRRHPEIGHQMLAHLDFLGGALDVVLHHQERWDGSGYPAGLAGEAIPLPARIFAVVDTFDALTSERPYKPPLPVTAACEEIRRSAGSLLDPTVVEVFLAVPPHDWLAIALRHTDGDATLTDLAPLVLPRHDER